MRSMLRRWPLALLPLLVLFTASPAEEKAPGPLEGTWKIVAIRYKNADLPAESFRSTVVKIDADSIRFLYGDKEKKEEKLTYRVDASRRAIDLSRPVLVEVDGKPVEHKLELSGIFQRAGPELKLSWTMPSINKKGQLAKPPKKPTSRPRVFDGKGSRYLLVLRRADAD